MGLLTLGTPLTWEEMKEWQQHVKTHGVKQFIRTYHKHKEDTGAPLKFGDEVEYSIFKLDHEEKTAKVSIRTAKLFELLSIPEKERNNRLEELGESEIQPSTVAAVAAVAALWRPEIAGFMLEGIPGEPYSGDINKMVEVEENMKERRKMIEQVLEEGEMVATLAMFPLIGAPGFTAPFLAPDPENSLTKSLFFPEEALYPHPRFAEKPSR